MGVRGGREGGRGGRERGKESEGVSERRVDGRGSEGRRKGVRGGGGRARTSTTSIWCSKKSRRTYNRCYRQQRQLTMMCQTNLSSVSQTASRNYPSYVCTRLWGPIISRTGFSKTSPTLSLLQSQPSTTAR